MRGSSASVWLTRNPIAIPIEVRGITRLACIDRSSAGSAGSSAVGVVHRPAALEALRCPPWRRWSASRAPCAVTVPPAVLSVVVAAISGQAAGVRCGSCRQDKG
jgi:hypothetical protein